MRTDARQAACFLECGWVLWWNGKLLTKQVELIAIPLFELEFPGCQAVFMIFIKSTLHSGFAIDALSVKNIQMAPGGKQPFMPATVNSRTGEEQSMVSRVRSMFE
jgi:hypothetical protein